MLLALQSLTAVVALSVGRGEAQASGQALKPYVRTILTEFSGSPDGSQPIGTPVEDASGALYGTTQGGGIYGYGSVFKMTPAGGGTYTVSVIYSFADGADGAAPNNVVLDGSGNVYGITELGGSHSYGTVYVLSPGAGGYSFSLLPTFEGTPDGAFPSAGLSIDANGTLYGTTDAGGAYGLGTAFRLARTGKSYVYQELYGFGASSDDGSGSFSSLLISAGGVLFGTTGQGGSDEGGTVYELSPQGSGYTESILHSFVRETRQDVNSPQAPLVADAKGNLFGTGYYGGAYDAGGVYEIAAATHTESVIHSFRRTDGFYPSAPVTLGASGVIFGSTYLGGPYEAGTVYALVPGANGRYFAETLLTFDKGAAGGFPGGLLLDETGTLFGEALYGGINNNGLVFKLTPYARK